MSTQEIFGKLLMLLRHPDVLPCLGGLVAMVFAIIVLVKMKKRGFLPNKLERKMAKARAMGHVVEGRLLFSSSYNNNRPGGPRDMIYRATYEFVVEGKTYQTTVTARRNFWPEKTSIYYLHSPNRAFTGHQRYREGLLPLALVVICFMVFYITATLLGFKP